MSDLIAFVIAISVPIAFVLSGIIVGKAVNFETTPRTAAILFFNWVGILTVVSGICFGLNYLYNAEVDSIKESIRQEVIANLQYNGKEA